MRAAVIDGFGQVPACRDVADPVPSGDEAVIDVLAAPIETYDRVQAAGGHYGSRDSFPSFPAVVGYAGVGRLAGHTVAFGGCVPPHATMAERTLVPRAFAARFAAIPRGVGAALRPGETVPVQGATGFAGRLAVQIARRLGAGRVVGTGPDRASMDALPGFGADEVIDLGLADSISRPRTAASPVRAGTTWSSTMSGGGRPRFSSVRWCRPAPDFPNGPSGWSDRRRAGADGGPGGVDASHLGGAAHGRYGRDPARSAGDPVRPAFARLSGREVVAEVERVPLEEVARAWTRRVPGRRLVVVPSRPWGGRPGRMRSRERYM